MKNKLLQLLLGIVLIFQLSGCIIADTRPQDPFYQDNGDWDHDLIPLIKPYYMVYLGKEFAWQMPLQANPPSQDTYYYYELHDIRKIAVEHGVIMIYTPFTEEVDTSIGQKIFHWFVVVPDQNIEKGFENETGFLAYIQNRV